MHIRILLLIALTIGLLQPQLFAQRPTSRPNDNYYKYEREEVGLYRDKISFVLPEPEIVPVEIEEQSALPDAISLGHLFPPGKKFHLDADPNLQTLVQLDIKGKEKIKSINGWRVQVYAGSSRSSATQRKQTLLGMFPGQTSYLDFEAPNFVVKVGDFMDKEEAILFCRDLRQTYAGAFVRPDQVQVHRFLPDLELESEDDRLDKN